jgi:hypothetical protein
VKTKSILVSIFLIDSGEDYNSIKEKYGNPMNQLRGWQSSYARKKKTA